jgi:hypothetical protein
MDNGEVVGRKAKVKARADQSHWYVVGSPLVGLDLTYAAVNRTLRLCDDLLSDGLNNDWLDGYFHRLRCSPHINKLSDFAMHTTISIECVLHYSGDHRRIGIPIPAEPAAMLHTIDRSRQDNVTWPRNTTLDAVIWNATL